MPDAVKTTTEVVPRKAKKTPGAAFCPSEGETTGGSEGTMPFDGGYANAELLPEWA